MRTRTHATILLGLSSRNEISPGHLNIAGPYYSETVILCKIIRYWEEKNRSWSRSFRFFNFHNFHNIRLKPYSTSKIAQETSNQSTTHPLSESNWALFNSTRKTLKMSKYFQVLRMLLKNMAIACSGAGPDNHCVVFGCWNLTTMDSLKLYNLPTILQSSQNIIMKTLMAKVRRASSCFMQFVQNRLLKLPKFSKIMQSGLKKINLQSLNDFFSENYSM